MSEKAKIDRDSILIKNPTILRKAMMFHNLNLLVICNHVYYMECVGISLQSLTLLQMRIA